MLAVDLRLPKPKAFRREFIELMCDNRKGEKRERRNKNETRGGVVALIERGGSEQPRTRRS